MAAVLGADGRLRAGARLLAGEHIRLRQPPPEAKPAATAAAAAAGGYLLPAVPGLQHCCDPNLVPVVPDGLEAVIAGVAAATEWQAARDIPAGELLSH
eukprot:SAG22_NODE_15476_length_348_cov_0.618474_1_plen_97_part_01